MSNCQVPAHISKTGDNGKPRGVVWGLGPGPQDLWTASCLPQKDRSSVLYLRVSGRQDKKKIIYFFSRLASPGSPAMGVCTMKEGEAGR